MSCVIWQQFRIKRIDNRDKLCVYLPDVFLMYVPIDKFYRIWDTAEGQLHEHAFLKNDEKLENE
jgi:hypothetical protein